MNQNRFRCDAFALQHVTSLQQVEAFFGYLVNDLRVNIHPDDDFADYVDLQTNVPTFTQDEAFLANNLMDESFKVCEEAGVDIYGMGADKLLVALAS